MLRTVLAFVLALAGATGQFIQPPLPQPQMPTFIQHFNEIYHETDGMWRGPGLHFTRSNSDEWVNPLQYLPGVPYHSIVPVNETSPANPDAYNQSEVTFDDPTGQTKGYMEYVNTRTGKRLLVGIMKQDGPAYEIVPTDDFNVTAVAPRKGPKLIATQDGYNLANTFLDNKSDMTEYGGVCFADTDNRLATCICLNPRGTPSHAIVPVNNGLPAKVRYGKMITSFGERGGMRGRFELIEKGSGRVYHTCLANGPAYEIVPVAKKRR